MNNQKCQVAGTITLRFTAAAGTYTLDLAQWGVGPVYYSSFTPVSQLNCVSGSQQHTLQSGSEVACDSSPGEIIPFINVTITLNSDSTQHELVAYKQYKCQSL